MKKKLMVMMLCGCMALTACSGESGDETPTPTEEAKESNAGGLLGGGNTGTEDSDDKDDSQTDNKDENNKDDNDTDEGNNGGAAADDTTEGAYWEPEGTVVLGEYMGIVVDKIAVEVTEEEVQEEIDYFLYYQAETKEITDRTTIEDGDIVNLDYTLVIDGEEIESYEDCETEIGIEEFMEIEKLLIGCETGTTQEFTAEIVDDVNYPDYLGKEGVWTVTINAIQERVIPELTNELVAETTDYTTVEEYKQSVYDERYDSKTESAESEQIVNGFTKIIENCEFSGLNEADVQSYVDELVNYYESYASMYGLDMESFVMLFTGSTYEDFVKMAEEQGDYVVKQNLILAAVLEKEKVELTDQEYTDGLTAYAAEYGYETPEEFEQSAGKEEVEDALLLDKVYNMIVDAMVIE